MNAHASTDGDETVAATVARVLVAYEALTTVGEEVEDEWTYITDLTDAWRERLERIAATRRDEVLDQTTTAAVDLAIDEVGSISDPHRAIDWLSTFPQVVILALGETP